MTNLSNRYNLEAFTEEYIPPRIYERKQQAKQLTRCFNLAQRGASFTVFLVGDSGTGKTCTAKHLMNKFRYSNKKVIYINCWETDTLNAILNELLSRLGSYFTPQSTNRKLSKLKELLKSKNPIIILDEIDKLNEKDRLLYNLHKSACLIVIANDRSALFNTDKRVYSRISGETILFDRYAPGEVFDILESRRRYAGIKNICSDEVLKIISTKCNGDARQAIQTLDLTIHKASEKNDKIDIGELQENLNRALELKSEHKLRKLTEHHRLMYKIICRAPEIFSNDLFRTYHSKTKGEGKYPVARRTFTEYIKTLERVGLIISERPRRKGRTRILRCA